MSTQKRKQSLLRPEIKRLFLVGATCLLLSGPDLGAEETVEIDESNSDEKKNFIQVEFRNLPLHDATRLLSEASDFNIVPSASVSETGVSLFLEDVNPQVAIDILCDVYRLKYLEKEETGVIRVYGEDEEIRSARVVTKFDQVRKMIEEGRFVFQNLALKEVLDIFSEHFQISAVPSDAASQVNVSFFLQDTDPVEALRQICQTYNLKLVEDQTNGVFRVQTIEEYHSRIKNNDETHVEVFTLLYPNVNDVAVAIKDIFIDQVQLSFGVDPKEEATELEERLDRFDVMSERGQTDNFLGGGGGGGSSSSNNNNSNNNNNDNNNSNNDSTNNTGGNNGVINPSDTTASIFITLIKRHNMMVVRAEDPEVIEKIRLLVQEMDVPTSMVLLELKVMSIDLDDNFNSVFEVQYSDETDVAGDFSLGDVIAPASDLTGGRRSQSLYPQGGNLTRGNFLFQYVNNDFRARMQVLQNDGRVTTLATPFILTSNNEVSRLFQGREVPLNRDFSGPQTVATSTGGATTTTPGSTEIEFRPVGTTLMITPNINADRTVTLRVLQESSSISSSQATVLVPTDTGFSQQNIDIVQAQTISGTLVAKDGLTVAVGGLIEENLSEQDARIPVLGDIPLLGNLFSRKSQDRERTELVVTIRPFILNTPAESAAISRQLMDELSLHPNAPDGTGTLDTFRPEDVLRPDLKNDLLDAFEFHSLEESED